MVSTVPEENVAKVTYAESNPQQNDEHYKLVNRVINYPTVSNLWETAKEYYTSAKDKSYIVKKSCEVVESNLDSTMKYLVNPVIENDLVKKVTEPVLASADEFGCKQLDRLEKLSETYQPTITSIKEKVNSIAENSMQTIQPVDQYLKNSYIASPINIAVNVTENLCNKYIPEEKLLSMHGEELEQAFRRIVAQKSSTSV